jgi:hypothetical protein
VVFWCHMRMYNATEVPMGTSEPWPTLDHAAGRSCCLRWASGAGSAEVDAELPSNQQDLRKAAFVDLLATIRSSGAGGTDRFRVSTFDVNEASYAYGVTIVSGNSNTALQSKPPTGAAM